MLFVCLILLPLIITIGWYIYYYWCMRTLRHIKGPTTLPFIGNGLDFSSTATILPACTNYFKKYGPIVKVMLGAQPTVLIADYKAIEHVLSSPKLLKKSILYKFFYKWLGSGLLTSDGAKWKQRRRMLTPSYHFQILEQFMPIFNQVSNILIEQLSKNLETTETIDVYPYISLATLDVICETAMGVPVNAQITKSSKYVDSVKTMARIILERFFLPYQRYDFLYQFTENYKIEKKSLEILHNHTRAVIESRRKELNSQKNVANVTNDDLGLKKRTAFLDMLLSSTDENGVPLSDEDIQEEVDTFMFEGHDTTSSAISFALFAIANNPEIQSKILEEQEHIFRNEIRDITYTDLKQMKYLEMVIKETLRMYPSVPIYGRQTTEDFKLTDDITLPAGFTIFVFTNDIHKDEKFYKNPENFDPERFSLENNFGRKPYFFVPFSAGPRNCIGQKFAMMEIKTTLSKIIQNFELSDLKPRHELKLVSESILKSDNGIVIEMRKRSLK